MKKAAYSKRSVPYAGKLVLVLAALSAWLGAVLCHGGPRKREPEASPRQGSNAEIEKLRSPEWVWLSAIGMGATQVQKVCDSSAKDRVTAALCVEPPPTLTGIASLYEALGLVGASERLVASATHSLGLSARIVSAANPRSFVFANNMQPEPIPYDELLVVTFARGEQFVEMVALDTKTYDWNFYLLAFEQACNETRCTPAHLLTDQIERDWTRWTLYSDHDLIDTALDCTSCHQPFGPGTHKLLLMRQIPDPWLHWGDFRGVNEHAGCSQDGPVTEDPGRHVPGEGLDVLLALEGPDGRHAGIPVAELNEAKSGRNFSDFLVDARLSINDSPYGPNHLQHQQELRSAEVLCELLDSETSTTWESYRAELRALGLPVPYPGADVLDPAKRAELLRDRAGHFARHADDDAFDVASSLLAPEAQAAVGLVPREADTAREILHQMCVRCHASNTPDQLKRAGFDAESLDRIDAETAQLVRERINLPRISPNLMPPRRAGELSEAAKAKIERYLIGHCSDSRPGACQ